MQRQNLRFTHNFLLSSNTILHHFHLFTASSSSHVSVNQSINFVMNIDGMDILQEFEAINYDSPFHDNLSKKNMQMYEDDEHGFNSTLRKMSKSSDCYKNNTTDSRMARAARRSNESKCTYGKQMHLRPFWCICWLWWSLYLVCHWHTAFGYLFACYVWQLWKQETEVELKVVAPSCTRCESSNWIRDKKATWRVTKVTMHLYAINQVLLHLWEFANPFVSWLHSL